METFCLGLLREWAKLPGGVTLYTTYSGGVTECEIPEGVERVCWNVRAKKSFLKLTKWLRTRPDDPCLALSQELGIVLMVLKRLHLIRNQIYFRESNDVVRHYGTNYKRITGWFWPKLDGILEQSRIGREETRTICRGKLPRCLVLRNIMRYDGPVADFGLSTLLRLVNVASYKPEKRQELLVEMLANGEHGLGNDWALTFWGSGERRAEVEALVAKRGLGGQVRFEDWTSDKDRIYRDADIMVLPSDHEGLPNVMLEALLRGKRVSIRPTVDGGCELLQDLGLGETWPISKAVEIPVEKWRTAREKLAAICAPEKVAKEIAEFMQVVPCSSPILKW